MGGCFLCFYLPYSFCVDRAVEEGLPLGDLQGMGWEDLWDSLPPAYSFTHHFLHTAFRTTASAGDLGLLYLFPFLPGDCFLYHHYFFVLFSGSSLFSPVPSGIYLLYRLRYIPASPLYYILFFSADHTMFILACSFLLV